ncbi:MAG: protein kinase family protein [Verrucomicrobiota bacterium]
MKCGSCGALIAREGELVQRDTFRQALKRARQSMHAGAGSEILCRGEHYALLQRLGSGEVSEVHLARRLGPMPFLATLKLSTTPLAAARYAREAEVLRELQSASDDGTAAYAAQRLPEVIAQGPVEDGSGRLAIVLRHPTGFWGSLAAVGSRFPQGIDPRHAVWIWRRMLDLLYFIHAQGWAHGGISPEHVLVHPQDHGVWIVGWADAQKAASTKLKAADLMRSARVVQVLLCGAKSPDAMPAQVPPPLAALITRAAHDESFCLSEGALGLDRLLLSTAREAFGPPVFVPLVL